MKKLTSLRVEEHEGLVEGLGVLVGGRRRGALVGDELDDHHDEADEEADAEDGADGPHEDLAVEDHAAEVDVLLLLPALVPRPGQQPALLRLVQRPRQRPPVQVQVPAPVVVRRRVVAYLQRPAPRVPPVHAHLAAQPQYPLAILAMALAAAAAAAAPSGSWDGQ